jgi:hypothetical protein
VFRDDRGKQFASAILQILMRYGADQELQRCEVRTPEFALPVQLDCCVGFCGGQIAIDLGQEGTSTARDKLIRCGIFSWMAIRNDTLACLRRRYKPSRPWSRR